MTGNSSLRVILFGSTGMVGRGALLECLESDKVEAVLTINRVASHLNHPKLTEIIHDDFTDYESIEDSLEGYDACFYCIGISSFGLKEEKYNFITHDLTMYAAKCLVKLNPNMTFCFVSGAGTDSTEKGPLMWARIKGKTENSLKKLPFKAHYMFRPGYIQPMKGVKSKTRMYQLLYDVFGVFFPLINRVIPKWVTSTERIGKVMIKAATEGCDVEYLGNGDINRIAGVLKGL